MPQKQKTSVTVQEDGTLLGANTGQELIAWLADTFALFADGRAEIAKAFRRAGVDQWHIMGPGGEMVRLPVNKTTLHDDGEVTTTTLDETEMSDYMEQIRHDEDVRQLDIAWQDEDRIHA